MSMGERVTILTGNDLLTGDVTWWTGAGWSRHIAEAVAVDGDVAPLIAAQEAARAVISAYAIEATRESDGFRPAHIKDRIRAVGPTVRLDLSLRPDDAAAPAWIA